MPTLFCGPGPGPAPGCARPARSAGASKPGARSEGGAPCAGSPAADGRTISHEATSHVDPHAIAEEEPRRTRDRAAPGGGARRSGHPSGGLRAPRVVDMRLTGRAP